MYLNNIFTFEMSFKAVSEISGLSNIQEPE